MVKPAWDDRVQKAIEEIARDFAPTTSRRLIPVCGSGFSLNVEGPAKPPDWRGLIQLATSAVARLGPRARDDLKFLVETCNDPLSTLTLLSDSDGSAREVILDQLQRVIRPVRKHHLLCHQAFWSTPWSTVVTTNFDRFLQLSLAGTKQATGRIETVDYRYPGLTRKIVKEIRRGDLPTIVHLHGLLGEPAEPLLTWSDYLNVYGWSWEDLERLRRNLVALHGLDAASRDRYREILTQQFRRAQRVVGETRTDTSRVQQVVDRLLADYSCLFIGFSVDDPAWRLLLENLTRSGDSARHFWITTTHDSIAPGKTVRAIPLGTWDALTPFFNELGTRIGHRLDPPATGEARSRGERYRRLREVYDFSDERRPGWIFQGQNSDGETTVVPFVELWHNTSGLASDEAVECRLWRRYQFRLHSKLRRVRSEFWNHRQRLQRKKRNSSPLLNERKMRVADWHALPDGRLRLAVQLADYRDFLISNWFVANVDESTVLDIGRRGGAADMALEKMLRRTFLHKGNFDPRGVLCGDAEAVALGPDAVCSNHLGVSLMLVVEMPNKRGGKTPVLVCPASRGQLSSPNDLVMAASGSVDWPLQADAEKHSEVERAAALRQDPSLFRLTAQVWREFAEECRHVPAQDQEVNLGRKASLAFSRAAQERHRLIRSDALINLCQNIERGGKPELFYLASIGMDGEQFIRRELRPNWELEIVYLNDFVEDIERARRQRALMLLPSPVGLDLELVPRPTSSVRRILQILLDSGFNPVLRGHLASLLRFCEVRQPERMARVLRSLRGELDFSFG